MATARTAVARYVPSFTAECPDWLRIELQKISEATGGAHPFVQLAVLAKAPDKPREGQCVMADGTNWNPGSGKGVYVYKSTGWAFLG